MKERRKEEFISDKEGCEEHRSREPERLKKWVGITSQNEKSKSGTPLELGTTLKKTIS